MKKLFVLFALATSWFVVSLARPPPQPNNSLIVGPPTIPSYYNRRYQLFDAILTQINRRLANQHIARTTNYTELLEEYTAWLAANHTQLTGHEYKWYEDLKETLEYLNELMPNFRNDRQNCELQRRVQTALFVWDFDSREIADKEFRQILKKYNNNGENYYDLELLAIDIDNFLQSLTDTEREENQKFIEWCRQFLTATTDEDKIKELNNIDRLYVEEFEMETKAGGSANCQLVAQIEWVQQMDTLYLHNLELLEIHKFMEKDMYKSLVLPVLEGIMGYSKLLGL